MMMSVICIVKFTRSQKPAPNQTATCTGELPDATLAEKTMQTAMSASANASGNQCSNHADRRSPAVASQEPAGREGDVIIGAGIIPNGRRQYNFARCRPFSRCVES